MSYGTLNHLNAFFSIGLLVTYVLLCILYYKSAKQTKSFALNRSLTLDELCGIIKAIPSHALNHMVKRIETTRGNALHLDCSTVKIAVTKNVNEIKCVYKLNGFINLIFTFSFGFFGIGGVLALFDSGNIEVLVALVIAVVVHIIRGKVLNRGRNMVVSIEEHLR